MDTKFSSVNCRVLCCKIKETTISKQVRGNMLREAFVWSTAPYGKFYWHEEWTRLKNGKELSPKALSIILEIMDRPKFTQVTNVANGVQLCRKFGLEW